MCEQKNLLSLKELEEVNEQAKAWWFTWAASPAAQPPLTQERLCLFISVSYHFAHFWLFPSYAVA